MNARASFKIRFKIKLLRLRLGESVGSVIFSVLITELLIFSDKTKKKIPIGTMINPNTSNIKSPTSPVSPRIIPAKIGTNIGVRKQNKAM